MTSREKTGRIIAGLFGILLLLQCCKPVSSASGTAAFNGTRVDEGGNPDLSTGRWASRRRSRDARLVDTLPRGVAA